MGRSLLLAVLALSCCGCATITRGTTSQVQIRSEPSEANVRTSLGHACVTPCTITVSRKDEFVVVFSKPGYQMMEIPVKTSVQPGGGGALAGNILVGGVVGLGADIATGAANDHVPNPVIAELIPDRPGVRPPRPDSKPPPARAPASQAEPAPAFAAPVDSLRN
jgi:hypothetical protein